MGRQKRDKVSQEIKADPTPKDVVELIQKYYNTTHVQGKRILLALIRRKKPGFKDERERDVNLGKTESSEETAE